MWKGPSGRHLEALCLVCFGSAQLLFGYDQGVLSGFVDTEPFLSAMGYPDSSLLGTITSIYNIGCLFGALSAFFIGDYLGRRWTIILGCLIVCVGGSIQAAASGVGMMIAGRIVTGLGTGLNTTTVPVFQAEVSLGHRRGTLVIAETCITIAGIAGATWIDFGIIYGGQITGENQWRTGLALQCIFPVIVFCTMPFIPESPRWLAKKGKFDKLPHIMARLQGRGAQATDPEIIVAANVIRETAEHEAAVAVGWRQVFAKTELQNGRRILLSGLGQLMQQMAGINLLAYYAPLIFARSLGFEPRMAHIMGGVGNTCFFIGSIFPVFTVEFGRRPIMLGGAVLCAIFMACLAGTTSVVESSTGSRKDNAGWASAAFIFLYYLAFGGTYNAIPWLWPAEINGLRTRGQGAAFATMNNWLWNFVIVQITPIGIENIGYQFYIIFAVLNFAFFFLIWFLYPETAGRTLEEMDELFINNPGWIIKKEFRRRVRSGKVSPEDDIEKPVASHRDLSTGDSNEKEKA